jgi:hypothetical protein
MANRTLWRSDEEADGFAEVYMSESGSIVGVRVSGDVEEHEAYTDCIRHLAGALDAATRERDEALRKLNHEAVVSDMRAKERERAERERDEARAALSAAVEAAAVGEAVIAAVQGEDPGDFMLSFGPVMEAQMLRAEVELLRGELVAVNTAEGLANVREQIRAECDAELQAVTRERDEARAQLRGVGVEEYLAAKAEVARLRAEVERLRAEHDQLREFHRRKVEGLTSSHAYLAAAADGAAVERARIVAWLREDSENWPQYEAAALCEVAADIEAGKHEK